MEIINILLFSIVVLSLMGLLGVYLVYLKLKEELRLVSDKLEKNILISKVDLEGEIKNIDTFLRTKGFTISLFSGLKEKIEEAIQTSHEKEGPTATPASYTGKY